MLESLPFESIPDPEYFFDQSYYGRVLSQMMDRLWAGRSLVLVSGPNATEKSAFNRRLKSCVPEKTRIIWLEQAPESGDELLLILTQELHIQPETTNRVTVLRDIKEHLLTLHDEGRRCLVIMGNVHNINDDTLDCVRLLNNLEKGDMYTNHFSLESLPFENVPDPTYFFDQGDYSRVLSRMKDSLRAGRGLMVVAGPIGTGKTTLSQKLMVSVPQQTKIIWLGEPPESSDDLLLFLTHELNIKPELSGRVFVLRDIKEYLQKLHNEGNRCLIIIDEVHKISDDVLECVRLLNNLEQGSLKLVQILLIGQEEFLSKLARPELESFKQRIAWLEAIGRMTPSQTQDYILHRLKVAGSHSDLFTSDALEAVVISTRGTPRLINTLCDRSLRVSYESNKTIVDLDSVRKAADDIGLGSEVFLWLMKREERQEMNSTPEEIALEEETDVQVEPDLIAEKTTSAARFRPTSKDFSQQPAFRTVNELLDAVIATFSANPLLQLFASTLLFAASVLFYIMRTKG